MSPSDSVAPCRFAGSSHETNPSIAIEFLSQQTARVSVTLLDDKELAVSERHVQGCLHHSTAGDHLVLSEVLSLKCLQTDRCGSISSTKLRRDGNLWLVNENRDECESGDHQD